MPALLIVEHLDPLDDGQGSDSEAGSRFAEWLLTAVATCRQQGRRLWELLVAAGEAVLHDTAARSLLPAPHES